jgi:hypothetical protein
MSFLTPSSFYTPTGAPAQDLRQLEENIRNLPRRIQTSKKNWLWGEEFPHTPRPDFDPKIISSLYHSFGGWYDDIDGGSDNGQEAVYT